MLLAKAPISVSGALRFPQKSRQSLPADCEIPLVGIPPSVREETRLAFLLTPSKLPISSDFLPSTWEVSKNFAAGLLSIFS